MHALPIFGITGRSLWFVVANIFSLFRLSWLPLAMLIATTYAMAYGIVQVSPGETAETITDTGAFLFASLTEIILNGIVLSVVAVNVHRIILFGDRRPNVYFAFPFGGTELLYVVMGTLTYFALALLIGVFAYVYYLSFDLAPRGAALLVAAMVEAAQPAQPTDPWLIPRVAAVFIVWCILALWLMLRLTVWPPAVVANNRLSLGEALRLSKGRVLALLGLMIASILAFITAIMAFSLVVAISVFTAAKGGESTTVLFDTMDLFKKVTLVITGAPVNPNAIVFEFFYLLTATAYTVAILSFAYKALKGFDVDNAIDKQSTEDDPTLHMSMSAL